MSLQLGEFLMSLSNESEEPNLDPNAKEANDEILHPQEFTIVTDETTSELDEYIEELEEASEKAKDETDVLEKLSGAVVALESKVSMLRGMRENGVNLNAAAARMYSKSVVASLESRGFPSALFSDEVNSMDTSFESEDRYDYSAEAEEKTEGLATKAKAMLKKAIDAIVAFFKNQWDKFMGVGKSIKTLGERAIAMSAKMGGATGVTVTTRGLTLFGATPNAEAIIGVISKQSNLGTKKAMQDLTTQLKSGDIYSIPGTFNVDLGGGYTQSMTPTTRYEFKGPAEKETGKEVAAGTAENVKKIGELLVDLSAEFDQMSEAKNALVKELERANEIVEKMYKNINDKSGAKEAKGNALTFIGDVKRIFTDRIKHSAKVAKQAYRFAYLSSNAVGKAKAEKPAA